MTDPPDSDPVEVVQLSALDLASKGIAVEESIRMTGVRLFRWVLVLVGVIALVVGLYAAVSFPYDHQVSPLLKDMPPGERLAAWKEIRADWRTGLIQFTQTILIAPFVPLLTAIVGYIFGSREESTGDS